MNTEASATLDLEAMEQRARASTGRYYSAGGSDEQWIAPAERDVPLLIAEVRRLRRVVDAASEEA